MNFLGSSFECSLVALVVDGRVLIAWKIISFVVGYYTLGLVGGLEAKVLSGMLLP